MGTGETRETYYKGNSTEPECWALIFFSTEHSTLFYHPNIPRLVRYLYEDEVYSFQVFSLSTTDYQAGSNEFDLRVPPYRRTRWIAIGCTLLIILTFIFAALFIHFRKRIIKPFENADTKLQRG